MDRIEETLAQHSCSELLGGGLAVASDFRGGVCDAAII